MKMRRSTLILLLASATVVGCGGPFLVFQAGHFHQYVLHVKHIALHHILILVILGYWLFLIMLIEILNQ